MAVANVFHNNAAFSSLVRRFFDNPGDADAQRLLQDWIGKCQTSHRYLGVFLTDTQGVIRLSAPEVPPMDIPHLARDAAEVLGSGQIAILDLHRDKPDGPIHPFYQVKGGTKDKTPGTGLGLSLTRRLVELHGGKIWMTSEGQDRGCRVAFRLPS